MTGEAATVATANHDADAAADRLGALFDVHHQRLYRLARRMSRSADEARDLVQDTFLRADAHQALCRGRVRRGSLAGEGARQSLPRPVAADGDPRAARSIDGDARIASADPEAAIVARSVVWHALATLDPRRRGGAGDARARGIADRRHRAHAGVTSVTVRWHLSKVRRQLAAAIRGEGSKP